MKETLKYIILGILLFIVALIIIAILAAGGVLTVNAEGAALLLWA